jgi:hypothetical protein
LFKLLNVENSKDSWLFIEAYNNFINTLKFYNTNNDKRLSRLYNRLYFIFSFALNAQKPEEFPIYFSATRNTLRVFWVEWYENTVKVYKEFLWNWDFKDYIKIYTDWIFLNNEYALKDIFPFEEDLYFDEKLSKNIKRKDLFYNHAKYRFFQDICWVLNRNVLDWQDYIKNLSVWYEFDLNEIKDNKYLWDITYWEILNIKYLLDEWYIKDLWNSKYKVIEKDERYFKNISEIKEEK